MRYPTIGGDVAEMHSSVAQKRVCEAVYRRLSVSTIPASASTAVPMPTALNPTRVTTGATAADFARCSAPMRCC